MSTGNNCFGVQGSRFVDTLSNRIGYFGELQANQGNGGETLESKSDDSKEVGLKMSTRDNCLGEQGGHFVDALLDPMGNFREVQVNQENGGETLKSKRKTPKKLE